MIDDTFWRILNTEKKVNTQRNLTFCNGYYIQNYDLVADHEIDLSVDPPPDLVVEVDITHTDINKNALYASMGVPEFWRFNGQTWQILCLN